MIKLTLDEEASEWSEHIAEPIIDEQCRDELLKNSFILGGNMIMLVLQFNILMLGYGDEEYEEFERIGVTTFPASVSIESFHADFNNEHGYLVALEVDHKIEEDIFVSMYEGC